MNTNPEEKSEKSEHTSRVWPALDINQVSDLVQAALVDFDTLAVEERSEDDWRVFFASAAERDRALAGLHVQFPGITVEPVDVPDENWAARSQASLRAVRVGNIIVAPPWDVPAGTGPQFRTRRTIVIQPSMGFGTGHHATTRLCLAALQRLDLGGCTVIDVGTGSGLLAIAASFLGATRVVAIDDDADAIASARENLALNSRADVTVLLGDLRSIEVAPADVVVANLTAGLLIAASHKLQELTVDGGRLVLSGLLLTEERDVAASFSPWVVEHRAEEDEWLCLTLRRATS